MNNYETSCLALDKELAEVLGWHRLHMHNFYGTMQLRGDNPSKNIVNMKVPRWTQDDAAAFKLSIEYSVNYRIIKSYDEVVSDSVVVNTQDFPSDDAACRYVIVQSVINVLKGS